MNIYALDHLVLTVSDMDQTVRFYREVLGMNQNVFADGRKALVFGQQKINLHQAGREFEPKAAQPTTGSADLCFLSDTPIDQVLQHFAKCGVTVIAGPVTRTGAAGPILSLYIRDPDGNLIEISNPA